MGKHRKDNTYYSNKELEQKTLKGIRAHIKNELYKMAQLTVELSKSTEIPIEWRKKGDKKLLDFIIKNKDLNIESIYKILK